MDRPARGDGASRQEASGQELTRDTSFIRLLRVVAVVVGLSPIVATLVVPALTPEVARIVYLVFKPVCHTKPERTIELLGVLMPLCSRCTGIFVGFVSAAVWPRPRWSIGASLGWGFVASVIMVMDVVMQDLKMHPVWHSTRIATGIVWGHVFALGCFAIGRGLVDRRSRSVRKTD